ncbi:MAG: hypothetical protein KF723_17965 [Rhizobiaceae bacterium]|nr:hypothetical protein [Rhizobiaceae bacterium]
MERPTATPSPDSEETEVDESPEAYGRASLIFAAIGLASIAGAVATALYGEFLAGMRSVGSALLTALMLLYLVAPVSLLAGVVYGVVGLAAKGVAKLIALAGILSNVGLIALAIYFLFFHWAS